METLVVINHDGRGLSMCPMRSRFVWLVVNVWVELRTDILRKVKRCSFENQKNWMDLARET